MGSAGGGGQVQGRASVQQALLDGGAEARCEDGVQGGVPQAGRHVLQRWARLRVVHHQVEELPTPPGSFSACLSGIPWWEHEIQGQARVKECKPSSHLLVWVGGPCYIVSWQRGLLLTQGGALQQPRTPGRCAGAPGSHTRRSAAACPTAPARPLHRPGTRQQPVQVKI